MKKIYCKRGGQPFPEILPNGDKFDSVMEIFDTGRHVYTANYVNTDPSLNDKYFGILAEGTYNYICDRRMNRPGNPKVLFLYNTDRAGDDKVHAAADLSEADRVLPSLVLNPNHENKPIISQVLVHNRANASDGSAGCITVDGFDQFISYFSIGDVGQFILTRCPTWTPDDRYRIV